MPGWRREFIKRFPSLQGEAQSATCAGALMHRPLFFILKEALDQGDLETVKNVISYVQWLDEHDSAGSATELEEDLLGPITDSDRLRAELLRRATPAEFEVIVKYCVEGWRSSPSRTAKRQALESEFRELHRQVGRPTAP